MTAEESSEPHWVFAYGSLIWRPGFAYRARVRGVVCGWARRFWQGSTDHRGEPDAPGRVVTLVGDQEDECWGVAYQLDASSSARTLEELGVREQGGYAPRLLPFQARDRDSAGPHQVLCYVAAPDNPNYLGAAPLAAIAEQVRRAKGPSGHNVDYVLQLAEALYDLNVADRHVFDLANLLVDTETTTDCDPAGAGG